MDSAWTAPAGATLSDLYQLPAPDTGRSSPVYSGLPQAASHASAPWTLVRHAPVQSDPMDSRLAPRVAERLADLRGCTVSQRRSVAPPSWRGGGAAALGGSLVRSRPCRHASCRPPFCHDGTERPMPRPTDATEQKTCYSGKKKRHMLKNLLLINTTLRIVFLSETAPGSIHDKRLADMTPYPLPAGSQLLQDVGFQGFTLEDVEILQPTKKPRGKALTPAQRANNHEIARRRVRIEHV